MELPALLLSASRAAVDDLHTGLARLGFADIRPAYGFAFAFLSHHPEATAVALAAHLGVTKQAATQLVDELTRLGYVERRPHPTDGRARVIALTDRGWACIRAVEQIWAEWERRLAGQVGPQALAQAKTVLRAVLPDSGPSLRPVW